MKFHRLLALLMLILLCLATGMAFAQDGTEQPPGDVVIQVPAPFYDPPALLMNACTDETEATEVCDMVATSPEDIVGVWTIYFQAEPMFIRYNADGTWLIADTVEHTNEAPAEGFPYGIYTLAEDGSFNSDDGAMDPALDQILDECANHRYITRVIKMGKQPIALNRVVIDDCFAPRRADWAYASLWVTSE